MTRFHVWIRPVSCLIYAGIGLLALASSATLAGERGTTQLRPTSLEQGVLRFECTDEEGVTIGSGYLAPRELMVSLEGHILLASDPGTGVIEVRIDDQRVQIPLEEFVQPGALAQVERIVRNLRGIAASRHDEGSFLRRVGALLDAGILASMECSGSAPCYQLLGQAAESLASCARKLLRAMAKTLAAMAICDSGNVVACTAALTLAADAWYEYGSTCTGHSGCDGSCACRPSGCVGP